jgi:hypothetical protein
MATNNDKSNAFQVAGVVSFYMFAALIVSIALHLLPRLIILVNVLDGICVRTSPSRLGDL